MKRLGDEDDDRFELQLELRNALMPQRDNGSSAAGQRAQSCEVYSSAKTGAPARTVLIPTEVMLRIVAGGLISIICPGPVGISSLLCIELQPSRLDVHGD